MRTMTRTTITRAAGLLATVALLAGSTTAMAHEGKEHDPDTDERVVGERRAEAADTRLIARTNDWEVPATRVFLEGSRVFAEISAELAERHPKQFAAAVYADAPGDPAVVRFVGEPPREALELLAKLDLEVKVEGDATYSARALQERTNEVHAFLLESGYEQAVAAAMPDGTIEATVQGAGEVKLPRRLADGVKVEVTEKPVAQDAHTRGGAELLDDGSFECTSGFTVQNGSGTTGIATAGHCSGLNEYEQPSDGLVYSMTHVTEHYGFWGDAEWKTTPHVEPAEYYASTTDLREVNSMSSWLPVNTPTCKFGRTTLVRTCDDVYSNYVVAAFAGPVHYFLMATDDNNVDFGDSGGPWSFGTEADGITKGFMTLGGSTRDVWMRASLFPAAIGVSVRTQ